MAKRYGTIFVYVLGIIILLFLACAPKQAEIPKQYTPPELSDDDLEIEEDIEMIDDLGHVIFGAAMGSQELVLTGGLSIVACRLAIYAKEKSNEQ